MESNQQKENSYSNLGNLEYMSHMTIQDSLPLEILTKIFEYLSYPDRIAASQVCTVWYEASLNYKFFMKEKVVLKKMNSEEIIKVLNILCKSNKKFFNFIFIECELNSKLNDYWPKLGPVVLSLSLDRCDIADKSVVDLLFCLKNLEFLDIIDCRLPLMTGRLLEDPVQIERLKEIHVHLKLINLGRNRYLSDDLFNKILSIAPNLRSFSLAGCQISFHMGIYKKFYPRECTGNGNGYASETVLTFYNIHKYLKMNAERINKIDFSKTLIDNNALNQISQIDKLKLKEFYLLGCEQLSNAGIINITEFQTGLTVLNVSYCSRVTDQALRSICKNLSNLAKLWVRNCRAITDLGVECLCNLKKLEVLDLSQCENISGVGLRKGLCGEESNKKLKELYLEGLNTITSETVILLAKCLPNVTHLNLSFCFNAVTDKSVQAIIEYQTSIRSLQLANCNALSDAGLTGMGVNIDSTSENTLRDVESEMSIGVRTNNFISLRSRAEDGIVRDAYLKKAVQKMCEANVVLGLPTGFSLRRLKGLQDLNLSSCNRITDVSLEYAFNFPELQHLNLSQCQQITQTGLKFVGSNNPGIETINLSKCYNITDEGILSLTKSLHRLKFLDIQGCNKLTDATKKVIADNCKCLRYLDIRSCTKMTQCVMEVYHMPTIQTLHFSGENDLPNPPPFPLVLSRLLQP
uniref:F-box domain-containing protein n=1 Tax=Clastoptera arizonana TaxID=38151 RepID=A0A1B6CRF7_9HEMI